MSTLNTYRFGSLAIASTGWTSPMVADEDNGWASYFNPDTSNVTFTWSQDNWQQTGVGQWASAAVAFKAPAK